MADNNSKAFVYLVGRMLFRDPRAGRKEDPFVFDFMDHAASQGYKPILAILSGIDFDARTVNGLDSDLNPVEAELPRVFFQGKVIYFEDDESREELEELYERANNGDIILHNPQVFIRILADKYKTHTTLESNPLFAEYLPKLYLLSEIDRERLRGECKDWVLKPLKGSEGEGVMRVSQASESDLDKAFEEPDAYVVQDFVKSALIQERAFDFRLVMMRRPSGFEVAYVVGRKAPKGSFMSNLSLGGEAVSLHAIGDEKIQKGIAAAKAVAGGMTDFLEESSGGHGSICGLDFMIDTKGRPWLIEGNSDPGWNMLYSEYGADREGVMDIILSRLDTLMKS